VETPKYLTALHNSNLYLPKTKKIELTKKIKFSRKRVKIVEKTPDFRISNFFEDQLSVSNLFWHGAGQKLGYSTDGHIHNLLQGWVFPPGGFHWKVTAGTNLGVNSDR
jgi:hypothetical protein